MKKNDSSFTNKIEEQMIVLISFPLTARMYKYQHIYNNNIHVYCLYLGDVNEN